MNEKEAQELEAAANAAEEIAALFRGFVNDEFTIGDFKQRADNLHQRLDEASEKLLKGMQLLFRLFNQKALALFNVESGGISVN